MCRKCEENRCAKPSKKAHSCGCSKPAPCPPCYVAANTAGLTGGSNGVVPVPSNNVINFIPTGYGSSPQYVGGAWQITEPGLYSVTYRVTLSASQVGAKVALYQSNPSAGGCYSSCNCGNHCNFPTVPTIFPAPNWTVVSTSTVTGATDTVITQTVRVNVTQRCTQLALVNTTTSGGSPTGSISLLTPAASSSFEISKIAQC